MGTKYTVKQLAERITPGGTPEELERTIRQLRHWTSSMALMPASAVHTGQGRARVYSDSQMYVAAVLVEMGRYGLPIRVVGLVGSTLLYYYMKYPKGSSNPLHDECHALLHDAIAGPRRVYLRFSLEVGQNPEEEIKAIGMSIFEAEGILAVPKDSASAFVVDLTELFSRLKA